MLTIRRWFIYIMCAIHLEAAIFSLIDLIHESGQAYPSDTPDIIGIYFDIFITGPVYLGYWLWASWTVYRNPHERSTFARRFYLYFIMGLSLAQVVHYGMSLIANLYNTFFKLYPVYLAPEVIERYREFFPPTIPGLFLLSGTVYLIHWIVKIRDERTGPNTRNTLILAQLYRYLISAVGLVLMVFSANKLLTIEAIWFIAGLLLWFFNWLTAERIYSRSNPPEEISGLLLWFSYWRSSDRTYSRSDPPDEIAIGRKFYYYFAILTAALAFIIAGVNLMSTFQQMTNQGSAEFATLIPQIALILISGLILAVHRIFFRREPELSDKMNQSPQTKIAPLESNNDEPTTLSRNYILLTLVSAIFLELIWFKTVIWSFLYFFP